MEKSKREGSELRGRGRMRTLKPGRYGQESKCKYFIKIKAYTEIFDLLLGEGLIRRLGLSCMHYWI